MVKRWGDLELILGRGLAQKLEELLGLLGRGHEGGFKGGGADDVC